MVRVQGGCQSRTGCAGFVRGACSSKPLFRKAYISGCRAIRKVPGGDEAHVNTDRRFGSLARGGHQCNASKWMWCFGKHCAPFSPRVLDFLVYTATCLRRSHLTKRRRTRAHPLVLSMLLWSTCCSEVEKGEVCEKTAVVSAEENARYVQYCRPNLTMCHKAAHVTWVN